MPLWDPRGTAPFEILSGDVTVLEHPQPPQTPPPASTLTFNPARLTHCPATGKAGKSVLQE